MYVSASHSTVLSPSGVTSVTVNAATMLVLADDDDDADFVRRPPAAAGRAARTGRAAFAFAATLRVRTAVTRPDLITLPAIFPSLYSSSSTYLHYFAFVVLSASLAISLSLSLDRTTRFLPGLTKTPQSSQIQFFTLTNTILLRIFHTLFLISRVSERVSSSGVLGVFR